MLVQSSILLLALSQLTSVSAAPAPAPATLQERASGSSFSIPVKHKHHHRHHVKNGPAELKKALGRYGLPIPKALQDMDMKALDAKLAKLQRKRQTVAASPDDSYDDEYDVPVTIGGQAFNLDFDTGSSDLWLYGPNAPSSAKTGHHVYNPTASKNYTALSGYTWKISYGDGSSASGTVGTDTVAVGSVTVTRQAIELATAVSSSFSADTADDGLLGLGFSNINTVSPVQQKTWIENALPSLKLPQFAANLKHQAIGSYDFGFANSSVYKGNLSYTPVQPNSGYWQFNAPSYVINGLNYSEPKAVGIADTGTTLLLMSSTAARNYYSRVSGAKMSYSYGGYVFPCSAVLPNITLSVGANHANIPGSSLNWAPVSSTMCFGGLQGSGSNFYIYGDMFFKSYYTVFNYGSTTAPFSKASLGIAPKA